jgi:hypothetical protein
MARRDLMIVLRKRLPGRGLRETDAQDLLLSSDKAITKVVIG